MGGKGKKWGEGHDRKGIIFASKSLAVVGGWLVVAEIKYM